MTELFVYLSMSVLLPMRLFTHIHNYICHLHTYLLTYVILILSSCTLILIIIIIIIIVALENDG